MATCCETWRGEDTYGRLCLCKRNVGSSRTINPHPRLEPIHFIDIAAQRARLGRAVDDAIARVLAHHQFIMGPEVRALESELRSFSGARHVISCANGTDALLLVLMAKDIGPSDAVFCPTFTFCATAEVVALVGATPVMIDVEEATFNIDPKSLARGITTAKSLGLKPKATIPVGLFGQPANLDAINALAKAEGLFVLDDAAQSFGASFKGRHVGSSRMRPPPVSFRRSRSVAMATAAQYLPTMRS